MPRSDPIRSDLTLTPSDLTCPDPRPRLRMVLSTWCPIPPHCCRVTLGIRSWDAVILSPGGDAVTQSQYLNLFSDIYKIHSRYIYYFRGRTKNLVMTSISSILGWHNLPEIVFIDIIMKIGQEKMSINANLGNILENLENLHICKQICRSWNYMIVSKKIF